MSYHFVNCTCSPAAGEESSAECFADIPAFALSNSTSGAGNVCSSGNAMESSQGFQCGTILSHSTGSRGEGESISSRAVSPARTSPQREKARALLASEAASGVKWQELCRRFDRDSYSWKTHRCLFSVDLPESSLILPAWGSMRDGELFRRPTPSGLDVIRAYITSAKDSGSSGKMQVPTPRSEEPGRTRVGYGRGLAELMEGCQQIVPTPRANDARHGENLDTTKAWDGLPAFVKAASGGKLNPRWTEWLMGWPIGLASCEPSEMGRFQLWLRSHGEFLQELFDERNVSATEGERR